MEILEEMGDFTKIGFNLFFVETKRGNFIWDSFNNVLTFEERAYYKYMYDNVITQTKYRGKRRLLDYCGKDVKVIIGD